MCLADEDGDGNVNYEEFVTMLFKVNNPLFDINIYTGLNEH